MRTFRLASLLLGLLVPVILAAQVGDVSVAVGNGQYQVYDRNGNFKQTITIGVSGDVTSGCAYDGAFNFYGTNTTQMKVVEVNAQTGAATSIATALPSESITFDAYGNFYVGSAATTLLKFVPGSTPAADGTITYTLGQSITTPSNTDWVDLANDQRTLFYTSKDFAVHRFNIATQSALADFATFSSQAFQVRLLPPFDGSGGVIVADTAKIVNTAAPSVTYGPNNVNSWIAVSLDPESKTIWAGDFQSGRLYHFDVATGANLLPKPGYISTGANKSLGGICVNGAHQQNVQPLLYSTGTNVKRIAVFGDQNSRNLNTWSATFDNITTPFTLVVSSALGINLSRFDEYFCNQAEQTTGCATLWPGTPSLVPIPYGNQVNFSGAAQQGSPVVYRVENPPPLTSYTGKINIYVGFFTPQAFYNPPLCATSPTNPALVPTMNPRLFRDPSSSPPADAAANHQFAFDFTEFVTSSDTTFFDPLSGGTRTTNDYVAADRCTSAAGGTATYNSPLSASQTSSPYKLGSVIPIKVTVTDGDGNNISGTTVFCPQPGASPCNDVTLTITGPDHSLEKTFFNPGNSFSFFTSNGGSISGNLDTTGLKAGFTTLCATSIDKSNPGGLGTSTAPGIFKPACVTIDLEP